MAAEALAKICGFGIISYEKWIIVFLSRKQAGKAGRALLLMQSDGGDSLQGLP